MAKKKKTARKKTTGKKTVRSKSKVNKSAAVRDYLKSHRKAKPAEVSETMKEQGIKVSRSRSQRSSST